MRQAQGVGEGGFFLLGFADSFDGQLHSGGFVLGFLEFGEGFGVGDDAGSDAVGEFAFFVDEGADGDVELGFAVEAEVSHGAGVEAAGAGFELGDDLGGAFFGGAGDGAAGEAGGEGVEVGAAGGEGAFDGGDEVVDVLEFFELEHVGDLDGAELADLSDVIAEEVGDHDELGGFLFGLAEVEGGA